MVKHESNFHYIHLEGDWAIFHKLKAEKKQNTYNFWK